MHTYLLRFLDLWKWLFLRLGVNYDQLRAIVEVKLTTDNRRQTVAYKTKRNKEPTNTFVATVLLYAVFGIFISFVIYTLPSFILSMLMFFTYIMVMIIMTLITDFSSILLDTSDNTIILPRPVDSRTLFIA